MRKPCQNVATDILAQRVFLISSGLYWIFTFFVIQLSINEGSKAFFSSCTLMFSNVKPVSLYLSLLPTSKKFFVVIWMLRMVMSLHCDRGMSSRSSGLKNCVQGRTTRNEPHWPDAGSRPDMAAAQDDVAVVERL